MLILPYRDRSYLRFVSARTGETIFELKMIDGALLVWGSRYRPNEFDARLDGEAISLDGTLRDSDGVVVTFSDQMMVFADYSVEVGELSPDSICLGDVT